MICRTGWGRAGVNDRSLSDVPLFPLSTVLYPGGFLPLRVFERRYLDMITAVMRGDARFGVVSIREGEEVGNAALSHMARGGIYLAGGVTLGVLDLLERGPFLDAIFDKGRMGALVRRMPVHVIREPHAALYGAARCVSLD